MIGTLKRIVFRKRPGPEVQGKDQARVFRVPDEAHLEPLKSWLFYRVYNSFGHAKDSAGNTILTLRHGERVRGTILVTNPEVMRPARFLVAKLMSPENEFQRWNRDRIMGEPRIDL